ncbi:MAG: hypothetical protein R3C45_01345 [Phycisphaerales bacterium]
MRFSADVGGFRSTRAAAGLVIGIFAGFALVFPVGGGKAAAGAGGEFSYLLLRPVQDGPATLDQGGTLLVAFKRFLQPDLAGLDLVDEGFELLDRVFEAELVGIGLGGLWSWRVSLAHSIGGVEGIRPGAVSVGFDSAGLGALAAGDHWSRSTTDSDTAVARTVVMRSPARASFV